MKNAVKIQGARLYDRAAVSCGIFGRCNLKAQAALYRSPPALAYDYRYNHRSVCIAEAPHLKIGNPEDIAPGMCIEVWKEGLYALKRYLFRKVLFGVMLEE